MEAREAIMDRRSVRRFLPDQVPMDSIRRIIECGAQAPSVYNIQPWKVHVIAGEVKDKISRDVLTAVADDPPIKHQAEFEYYPTEWHEPFQTRRRAVGHELYGALGIARDDKAARTAQMNRNFVFFDAPVALFVTVDNRLPSGLLIDIGMFIENLLVGARAEGLHTCGQGAFNFFHKVIRPHLDMEDTEMLACGIALGFEDASANENKIRPVRLGVDEIANFYGFD
ncbi:MAG: nitroreductase [Alphaproteobacteria bacterium]